MAARAAEPAQPVSLLKVDFPGSVLFLELLLEDPLSPASWTTVRRKTLATQTLTDLAEADTFFTDIADAHQAPLEAIFISISQDADGRHNFVNLGMAAALLKGGDAGEQLLQVSEDDVKAASGSTMLYAKVPIYEKGGIVRPADPIPMVDEYCPHASIWATNYSVIPGLSLGLTRRMILVDERTLCRSLPEELIFDHLKLIVNCHETKIDRGKYKVGTCSAKDKPKIICQAVHRWFSLGAEDMNRANDEIQEAMWETLQTGTVAVHCLAGIHRAACIVACHYLWRHYALGHTDVSADPHQIYNQLKAARPAVEPAYTHVLQAYAAHLQKRHAPAQAPAA